MAMAIEEIDAELRIKRIERIHDLIENHVLHPQLNLKVLH